MALLIINEVFLQKKKQEKEKRKRPWCREWLKEKDLFSNVKLVKTLQNTEPCDFKNYLRMDDNTFENLLAMVAPLIKRENTIMRKAITVKQRLIITLRYLATGNSFADLQYSSAVSRQFVGEIVIETCLAIIEVLKDLIKVGVKKKQIKKNN